jgi:hypothetical protein
MNAGVKEILAALLAGVAIVAISDFVYMQAQFGRWFHPAFNQGGGMPAPTDPASGGLPAGAPGGNGGQLPDPVTC